MIRGPFHGSVFIRCVLENLTERLRVLTMDVLNARYLRAVIPA